MIREENSRSSFGFMAGSALVALIVDHSGALIPERAKLCRERFQGTIRLSFLFENDFA